MDSMTLSTMSMSNPASRMSEHESARGVAPITEISLTVPATESDPMSPPGKNSGLTVCPSVVKTMSSTTAESSKELSGTSDFIFGKCDVTCLARNSCMISPPVPWFMMTFAMLPPIRDDVDKGIVISGDESVYIDVGDGANGPVG